MISLALTHLLLPFVMQIVAADPKTQQGMMLGMDLYEADVLVSRTSTVAVYQVEINRQMGKIIELTNKQKNVLII